MSLLIFSLMVSGDLEKTMVASLRLLSCMEMRSRAESNENPHASSLVKSSNILKQQTENGVFLVMRQKSRMLTIPKPRDRTAYVYGCMSKGMLSFNMETLDTGIT